MKTCMHGKLMESAMADIRKSAVRVLNFFCGKLEVCARKIGSSEAGRRVAEKGKGGVYQEENVGCGESSHGPTVINACIIYRRNE